MPKKNIAIAGAVVAVVIAGNVLLTPYLHRRETARIVRAVLEDWKNGQILEAFQYWENPQKSPPVEGLVSYKINQQILDEKDGRRHARIFTMLEFPSGETAAPSGLEWVFELQQTRIGWKITDWRLSSRTDRQNPD